MTLTGLSHKQLDNNCRYEKEKMMSTMNRSQVKILRWPVSIYVCVS